MHISTKPVGSEEIHLWPAFLFDFSAEHIESQAARPDPAGVL
jgi:hypothetical protein